MRHETCWTCRTPGLMDEEHRAALAATESHGPFTHHHHAVTCGRCGQWWFDDVVTGAFRHPSPARRDTRLCRCPEGPAIYTPVLIQLPQPEESCACSRKSVEQYSLQVHVMPYSSQRPG